MEIKISKRTLVDPIPCFIPIWTAAIQNEDVQKLVKEVNDDNWEHSSVEERLVDRRLLKIEEIADHRFQNAKCCLVGEANGFDRYIDKDGELCSECDTLCGTPAYRAVLKGGDTLIKFKVRLHNHMVDKHKYKGKFIDIKRVPKTGKVSC